MGVLKVNVGTVAVPDWRNIGCGGSSGATGRLKLWTGSGWVREVCGNETEAEYPASPRTWGQKYIVRRDYGAASCDITVTHGQANTVPTSCLIFALNTSSYTCLALEFNSGTSATVYRYNGTGTFSRTSVTSSWALTAWSGSTTTLRLVYNQPAGTATLYQNGVNLGTKTVSSPLTGTHVGFGTDRITSGITFDDFISAPISDDFNRPDSVLTINPASDGGRWIAEHGQWGITSNKGYLVSFTAGTHVPARPLKVWDGTAWQTVACMVPA